MHMHGNPFCRLFAYARRTLRPWPAEQRKPTPPTASYGWTMSFGRSTGRHAPTKASPRLKTSAPTCDARSPDGGDGRPHVSPSSSSIPPPLRRAQIAAEPFTKPRALPVEPDGLLARLRGRQSPYSRIPVRTLPREQRDARLPRRPPARTQRGQFAQHQRLRRLIGAGERVRDRDLRGDARGHRPPISLRRLPQPIPRRRGGLLVKRPQHAHRAPHAGEVLPG